MHLTEISSQNCLIWEVEHRHDQLLTVSGIAPYTLRRFFASKGVVVTQILTFRRNCIFLTSLGHENNLDSMVRPRPLSNPNTALFYLSSPSESYTKLATPSPQHHPAPAHAYSIPNNRA